MNSSHSTGMRNLAIVSWMGLACQALGVVSALSDLAGFRWGTAEGGMVAIAFGIAISGWAGNLREIIELKQRLSRLEGGTAPSTAEGV